jgi:hypothetical protein
LPILIRYHRLDGLAETRPRMNSLASADIVVAAAPANASDLRACDLIRTLVTFRSAAPRANVGVRSAEAIQ